VIRAAIPIKTKKFLRYNWIATSRISPRLIGRNTLGWAVLVVSARGAISIVVSLRQLAACRKIHMPNQVRDLLFIIADCIESRKLRRQTSEILEHPRNKVERGKISEVFEFRKSYKRYFTCTCAASPK
jgi:DNA-binding NtrC family response regulator